MKYFGLMQFAMILLVISYGYIVTIYYTSVED